VVLPVLYPLGLSTSDFAPALGGFFGSGAGLSAAAKTFADAFPAFPKATAKIVHDIENLLGFQDFSAGHRGHLRTTNSIESALFEGPLRTRVTRGAGSRRSALAKVYKPLDVAQARWHRIAGPELVPLVRPGAAFIDGKLQEGDPPRLSPTLPRTGRAPPKQKLHPKHLIIVPRDASRPWSAIRADC
jgi:hypothetical protein